MTTLSLTPANQTEQKALDYLQANASEEIQCG